MSQQKSFETTEVGTISVRKNKRSKRIKLQFDANTGTPTVTIPSWMPFATGKQYALKNQQWIIDHRPDISRIENSSIIGRSEKLQIVTGESFSARLVASGVKVTVEHQNDLNEPERIKSITDACNRSLKRQALVLAESSLQRHIQAIDTDFAKLRIARTHRRWGSCSSDGTLSFSIYIAQLPDHLIDYVVVHELAHTHQMNHSKDFWDIVARRLPNYKQLKKQLNEYPLRLKLTAEAN